MEIALPLDKMKIADKFRTLEDIWDSLRRSSKDIPVPAWHADERTLHRLAGVHSGSVGPDYLPAAWVGDKDLGGLETTEDGGQVLDDLLAPAGSAGAKGVGVGSRPFDFANND